MRFINMLFIGLLALTVGSLAAPTAAKNGETQTEVTPHLQAPIVPGQNVLFCSTFQIAWNSMKNEIIKDNIRLEKPLDVVEKLNNGRTTKDDIAPDDYYAIAACGRPGLAAMINGELKNKFGGDAPAVDTGFDQRDAIVAYTALRKHLQFADPFEDYRQPMTFHEANYREQVESFGVCEKENPALRNQVEIIDTPNRDEIIIRLKSKNPNDEIILAKVPPKATLLETFEKVSARVAGGTPRPMEGNEALNIPKIDVSLDHSYSSLLGLFLLNKGFDDYFIARADHNIAFRLDESGATAKSTATFMLKKMYITLAFDKPFLLYLKRKDGKYPYLALWVGNAGLLVHSE